MGKKLYLLRSDKDIKIRNVSISVSGRKIPIIILSTKEGVENAPGVLWIHGGGYFLGMKEMVYMSRAMDLVKNHGAVVVCPGYRLAFQKPYPAALTDCYQALKFLHANAEKLGVRKNQIMVGGESAGGGLCAALCMLAKDKGKINIAYQMPLYPMIDNLDTESSKDNHGRVWNTKRNHLGWKMYLRRSAKNENVSSYAAPARREDYSELPPAYTFVGNGEPFFTETCNYVECLKTAGVDAEMDIYDTDIHAFDMLSPSSDVAIRAIERFNERFAYAKEHYFSI